MGRLDNLIRLNTAGTCAYTKMLGLSLRPVVQVRDRPYRCRGYTFPLPDTRVTSYIGDKWDRAVGGKEQEISHAR